MIGAHTARDLVDLGHDIVVTTHRRAEVPSFLAGRVTAESLDVTDRDAFLALGGRHAISDIVHLAGSIPGDDPVDFSAPTSPACSTLWTPLARGTSAGSPSSLGAYIGPAEIPWHEGLDLPAAVLPHLIIAFKKAVPAMG
jgi:hypothetical protein